MSSEVAYTFGQLFGRCLHSPVCFPSNQQIYYFREKIFVVIFEREDLPIPPDWPILDPFSSWFWQDFEKFSADLADAKETVVTSLVPKGVGKKKYTTSIHDLFWEERRFCK